jgi:hypothetical protein
MSFDPQEPSGKFTLGEIMRTSFNKAVNRPEARELQLKMVNDGFEKLSRDLQQFMLQHMGRLTSTMNELRYFYGTKSIDKSDEDLFLEILTKNMWSMKIFQSVPINVSLIKDFSERDVMEMPGYIHLHEVAQQFDMALSFMGLASAEAKMAQQISVMLDIAKSYEQGAADPYGYYPDLGQKEETLDLPPNPITFSFKKHEEEKPKKRPKKPGPGAS